MKVVIGSDKGYKVFYDNTKKQLERLGYDILVYDLGDLGEGIKREVKFEKTKLARLCSWKPAMILDAFDRTDCNLVYTDVDVIFKERIDEIWEKDFDAGITIYPLVGQERERALGRKLGQMGLSITGYLGAGTIFLRHTSEARRFLEIWIQEMEKSSMKSDQQGLTSLAKGACNDDWTVDRLHEYDGIKIYFFPAAIYNYTFDGFPQKEEDSKITVYPGKRQKQLREMLCQK